MSDVLNHLREIEVLNSCSDTTYSLKKSVAYFATVGRSDVQRVLLLLTKDDSNHPAEETILYAEEQGILSKRLNIIVESVSMYHF